MSTLLDRLHQTGRFVLLSRAPLPIIVGTEVSRLIFGGALEMRSDDWRTTDIPTMTPPFREFFVESRVPSMLGEFESSPQPWPFPGITSFGVHFFGADQQNLDFCLKHASLDGSYLARVGSRDDIGWMLLTTLYIENHGREHYQCCQQVVFLGKQGQPLTDPLMRFYGDMSPYRLEPCDGSETERNRLFHALFTVLYMTVCFLNCKGKIALEAREPDAALQKKHRKKHGYELFRYHVLKVGGMADLLRHEGRMREVGMMQALHLCRGHIKTYTEAHKLFGKVAGSFYWEPQVRGKPAQGVVTKDYEVRGIQPKSPSPTGS